jgi:hypothetical protein
MDQEHKRRQSFLLRLPLSVRDQAIQRAHEDGISLNHFISLAVVERMSRMENPAPVRPALSSQAHKNQPFLRSIKFPQTG